jgi:hypothetical protein
MSRSSQLLLFKVLYTCAWADHFRFDFNKHICGLCHELQRGLPCDVFGACHAINSSNVESICKEHCAGANTLGVAIDTAEPDVRVTKGFGTKAYSQIRVSVVSASLSPPVEGFFDYSARFKHRWTNKYLHSAMKSVTPGKSVSLNVGAKIDVKLPEQGSGVAGVLIADPCMGWGSITSLIGCTFGKRYQTNTRTVELLNTFVPDDSTDFWGIFGDNFYDRTGEITKDVFNRISLQAKAKVFLSVPGNHDYWVFGSGHVASPADQCGNGYMQFYAQDTKAAENVSVGNSLAPYDFSVDPSDGHRLLGCKIPSVRNFFWYNQIGNIGFVGQSGAHSYADLQPLMREACTWLGAQPGLKVAVLVGHWDVEGLGATKQTAMPAWYMEMAALPGCAEFEAKGMLKFVMGHTHCNGPHPRGKVGAGFRVAGFGMEGCGHYGLPLVDTTQGRVRFWYFDTSSDALYNGTIACVKSHGWRQCTHLATLWLDEVIPQSEQTAPLITV